MKAVLLAAGCGTRLGHLTTQLPKPMLPLQGKPILEHNLLLLKKCGIKEIYINLYYFGEKIRNYFEDGRQWDVNIHYSVENVLLGTAGAIKNMERDLKGHRLIIVYGDNYHYFDIKDIIDFHQQKGGLGSILLFKKEDVSQSGIAQINDQGLILRFIEKPKPEQVISHLVNAGIYIFEAEILDYIPEGGPSDFGKDIFPKLIQQDIPLYGFISKTAPVAIDTPELYSKAINSYTFKGKT